MSVTAAHQNIAELYVRAELNAYSETFRVLKEKETASTTNTAPNASSSKRGSNCRR